MKGQIVCIGGIHGAGKSTVCHALSERFGWPVVKQRRLLIQIGEENGLQWSDVARQYDMYLDRTADRMIVLLQKSESGVLLIDCHYAIPSAAAVRKNKIGKEFVQNLDWRLVERLSGQCRCRFVHLRVRPDVALSRITDRPDAEHYTNTLEHFIGEASAELDMFNSLLAHLCVGSDDWLCHNALCVEHTMLEVARFVSPALEVSIEDHP
ncbi:MAG: AAA family ATPase [bacterium]